MNQHYTNSVLGVMLFKMGRLRKSKFCDQSQAEEIQIQKKKKKSRNKDLTWTCDNYNNIFLAKFEIQKMVSKSQRKIKSLLEIRLQSLQIQQTSNE